MAQIEDDCKYTKKGPKQRLQHSNDLGARREKEKRMAEDCLEVHGGDRKRRGGMEIME